MTKPLYAVMLATLLVLPAWAAKAPFKMIHVDDLAQALDSKTPPVVCDANGKDTREKNGIIPGARLLSSSAKFDIAKELPADKKTPLVFYCANARCLSSHSAAKRAMKAGFADVSVMADGIDGWRKAGKPVEKAVTRQEGRARL